MSTNIEYIRCVFRAGLNCLLQGAPGCGKTSVFHQLAEEAGEPLHVIIAAVQDRMDVMGIPYVTDGVAGFAAFGVMEQIWNCTKPTRFLIDDLGQAPSDVQASWMQVLLLGRLGDKVVSPHARFMIATNRPRDKAGVYAVLSAVRSRTVCIDWSLSCTCGPDGLCDWHVWAATHGIHPSVQAFARFRRRCMDEYNESDCRHDDVVCSARALEFLSRLEWAGIPDPALPLIQATIGPRYAAEYLAFRAMYQSLPVYDEIVTRPDSAPVPTKDEVLIAVGAMLAHSITPQTCDACMRYILRLPREISVCIVLQAVSTCPQITSAPDFAAWARDNARHLLD